MFFKKNQQMNRNNFTKKDMWHKWEIYRKEKQKLNVAGYGDAYL